MDEEAENPKPARVQQTQELSRRLDSISENQRITYSGLERMQKSIEELKDDYRDFRETYLVKHGEVKESERLNSDHITQHAKMIEELRADVKALNKAVEGLMHTNKIITWVAAGIGTLVLSLLFGILLDKIHIIAP